MSPAQGSKFDWATATQGQDVGMTHIYNQAMVLDDSGNVYTTGRFNGTVDFDPGPGVTQATSTSDQNAFVAKMNAAGNFVWVKIMQGNIVGSSIALDANNNIYSSGYYNGKVDFDPGAGIYELSSHVDSSLSKWFSNIYISKLDATGNFMWARTLGTIADSSNSCASSRLVTDATGNVYTTGYFSGTFDFDPGAGTFYMRTKALTASNSFILKLNTSGDFVWAKQLNGKTSFQVISVDATKQVYLASAFKEILDADPGPAVLNISAKNEDVFILKLTEAGELLWVKTIAGGPKSKVGAGSLAVDASGNTYITGTTSGSDSVDMDPGSAVLPFFSVGKTDSFISKLDAAGNLVWAKPISSMKATADVSCYSVYPDHAGNIYATGLFNEQVDFDPDTTVAALNTSWASISYVLKLDANGNFVTVKKIAEGTLVRTSALAVDTLEHVYTTGIFAGGALDFDPGPDVFNLTSSGFLSSFIQKMKPCTSTYGTLSKQACFSYTWNGQTFTKSGTYKQMLTNAQGCDSILSLHLQLIDELAICMVTVDSASTHNIIVWEKPLSTQIDSFRIYRENKAGKYIHIGSVAYLAPNEYHDDTLANPNTESYKYKIGLLTKCNTADTLSIYHQTMHVVKDYNALLFNIYDIENTGGPFLYYTIYRDDNNTGNFQPLAKITKHDRVFNILDDAQYPHAKYMIASDDFGCTPSGMLSISRSNSVDNLNTGIFSNKKADNRLFIYPNPAKETVTILLPGIPEEINLKIVDMLGETLVEETIRSKTETKKIVHVEKFAKGIYSVILETNKEKLVKKLVIN